MALLRQADREYFDLERIAGGPDAARALLHGAIPGLVSAAAFPVGAELGASAGAFAGGLIGAPSGPGEGIAVPVGTAVGALIGGTYTAYKAHQAATAALEKIGHYSASIRRLNEAAARHPYLDAAGGFAASALNPVNFARETAALSSARFSLEAPAAIRSARAFAQTGRAASQRVLQEGGSQRGSGVNS